MWQILHVRVVEARGLMAADMSGKSDPFVKLSLTGRYAVVEHSSSSRNSSFSRSSNSSGSCSSDSTTHRARESKIAATTSRFPLKHRRLRET